MNMTHMHTVGLTPNIPQTHAIVDAIASYCKENGIAYKIFEDTTGITIEYGANIVHQFLDIATVTDTDCQWK